MNKPGAEAQMLHAVTLLWGSEKCWSLGSGEWNSGYQGLGRVGGSRIERIWLMCTKLARKSKS